MNKMLNNDTPGVPLRCINALLHFGKSVLVNHTNAVEFVIQNINSHDMAYMPSKLYIVQSIIENIEYFINNDQLNACLSLANLNEVYQVQKAKIHNVAQYGIILMGFIFRLDDTMKLLESIGIQDKVLQDIMANQQSYTTCTYDKKVGVCDAAVFLWHGGAVARPDPQAVRDGASYEDIEPAY